MKRTIELAFPHCSVNSCIDSESASEFFVHDDSVLLKSRIYKGSQPLSYPKFTIKNPLNKEIYLLSVDNCIFFAADGKKCDFSVFSDKELVFVEIKKGGGSEMSRSDRKKEAIEQLRKTLDLFLNKITFSKCRVLACVSVGYFEQKPAAAASDLNLLVEFINTYNVELIEGNEFEFKK